MSKKAGSRSIEIPHDQLSRLKQLQEIHKKNNDKKKEK